MNFSLHVLFSILQKIRFKLSMWKNYELIFKKKWKWSRNRYLTWSWRHADMYFVIYLYFCSCLTQHWLVVQIIYGVLCFLCMILCIHSLFRNLKTHSIQMTLLALVLNMLPYYFTTQFYLLRNQYHSKKREKGKLFFMSHLWNTA